jgi:NadR type nicotinamide-nucleotide adenylyltransferase
MEPLKTTGLVLGKFAPFHKGHQYLIDFALPKVDRLYILVYEDAGLSGFPLSVRADWIRKLVPEVIVIEGHGSPTIDNDTPFVMALQASYIVGMMPEPINYLFTSEWYGEHVAEALKAENVVVDEDRVNVSISATVIRARGVSSNQYLHPLVNRDFIKKIVFLGGESTGKSTLAKACADLYQTGLVEEYGREYWLANRDANGQLTADQLVELAANHIRNEEGVYLSANGIAFVDTNAFITKLFCQHYELKVPCALNDIIDLERDRYDLFILCDTDIPFVQDGTRNDDELRSVFQRKIIDHLNWRGIPYHVVSGTPAERLETMTAIINARYGILPPLSDDRALLPEHPDYVGPHQRDSRS